MNVLQMFGLMLLYLYMTYFRATASGGAKGTASITVTVTENKAPSFAEARYSACIADGSVAGILLVNFY